MEKKKKTNFEMMAEKGRMLFLDYDRNAIAGKYGTLYDDDYLYINVFGKKHLIDRNTGFVYVDQRGNDQNVPASDRHLDPAGPGVSLTLYDVFCYGKPEAVPRREYININSLVHTISSTGNPGGGLFLKQENLFSGHVKELKEAGKKLGGILLPKGDVSFELQVFDFMNCRFQFYDADDEFPASITVFLDGAILDYMHFETTWYLVSYMCDLITEAASLKKDPD